MSTLGDSLNVSVPLTTVADANAALVDGAATIARLSAEVERLRADSVRLRADSVRLERLHEEGYLPLWEEVDGTWTFVADRGAGHTGHAADWRAALDDALRRAG